MARNLGINIKIGADLKQFSTDMQNAQRQMRRTSRKFKQIGSSMTRSLTLPLGLMGGAMIKFASDTQESLNKVNVAFGDSSKEVQEFSKTTLKSFGIARGSALDMAATFGDMGTSMGLSQDRDAKMSMKLVALAGDLASFKNIRIDVAQTALTSIFTGETESLKKLGIVMTQANLSAFALEQGITKPLKEMSEGEKTMLRYQFVMAKTSNAHGDFERTGGGAANQMRIFQEGLKELGDTFGQIVLPMFTSVVQKANQVVQWFGTLSESTKKVILAVGGLVAVLGPIALGIGAILPLLPSLVAGLSVLISPIGLVVAGLTAVAVVVYKNWDKISDKFWEVYDSSKPLRIAIHGLALSFKVMYEVAKLSMTSLWEVVKGVVGTIADAFGGLSKLQAGVFTFDIEQIKNGFTQVKDSVKNNFGKAFDNIGKKSKEVFTNMTGDLADFVDAVKNESQTLRRTPIKIKVKKELGDNLDGSNEDNSGGGNGGISSTLVSMDAVGLSTKKWAKSLQKVKDEIKELKPELKSIEPVIDSVGKYAEMMAERWQSTMESMKQGLEGLITDTIADFFSTLGSMFAGGENDMKGFGKRFLSAFGGFLGDFGKMLIAFGVAKLALFKSLSAGPAGAVTAIAAGAALVAIGGAISTLMKDSEDGFNTSGSIPTYSQPTSGGGTFGYGNTSDVLTLETVVYGRDIVLSSNRQHGTISRTRRK